MATTFSVPKSPSKSTFTMTTFQGCDFTNSPANVDNTKSPNCVNMVRDVPGKIRKSMGYKTQFQYPDKVNGAFYLRSVDEQLIHAGTKIYHNNVLLYDEANDHRSKSWQFGDKLYIQDGKEWLVHYCEKVDDTGFYGEHKYETKYKEYEIEIPSGGSESDKLYFKFEYEVDHIRYRVDDGAWTQVDSVGYSWELDNPLARLTVITFFKTNEETTTYDSQDGISEVRLKKSDSYLLTPTDNEAKYLVTYNNSTYKRSANTEYYDDLDNDEDYVFEQYTSVNVNEFLNTKSTRYEFPFVVQGKTAVNESRKIYIRNTWYTEIFIWLTYPNGTTRQYHGNYSAEFDITEPGTYTLAYISLNSLYLQYENRIPNISPYTVSVRDNYSGNITYTVGRESDEDGIIDNLDGDYVDSEGYKRYVKKVSEDAYIPIVTIAKEPQGGGESYYALNLIQPGFIELFQGQANVKSYQLSFNGLDDTEVKAWILDGEGDWVEKTENTHFSVDRENGIVTFTTAPGPSVLTGEDNVKIQAYRTVEGYADRVNKCTISTLFGVKGNGDRIFASGNPDYINYDWYCEKDDPTYWPDIAYSTLGSSQSAIVGYSIISNYLAAHKDDYERDANIILREGNLEDNEPVFPIVAALQGAGAVAPWSFTYLETEPVFLTKRGIYAVTAQDITGEKYSQNRSYYIDGKLLNENDLSEAYACVYNDFYILCLNGKLYILDGLQPIQTDKSMPYATRQYACFYRENVPANCMWVFKDELYFGTTDGKVCKFYTDKTDLYSYNDDGEAIECVWESPDLDGKLFFKNKTFRYLAVRLDSAISTSINIFTMKRGVWSHAKSDSTKARYFSFPYLNFNKFSFSTDTTQKIIHTKLRVKKVDKARFRFTNTEVNEPFGIFDVALEFVENGNYKG